MSEAQPRVEMHVATQIGVGVREVAEEAVSARRYRFGFARLGHVHERETATA